MLLRQHLAHALLPQIARAAHCLTPSSDHEFLQVELVNNTEIKTEMAFFYFIFAAL